MIDISIIVHEISETINEIYQQEVSYKAITAWPVIMNENVCDCINIYSQIDGIKEIKFARIEDLGFVFKILLAEKYIIAKTDF